MFKSKRTGAQLFFFLLQNPLLLNFFTGKIYRGRLKMICTPGLNCYSCPAAITACPVGAMQLFLAGANHGISLFVTGFLISVGAAFGRLICGYVCPMGFLQDLLYKIKTPKRIVRLRFARYIKYLILLFFVLILPFAALTGLSGLGEPWFCKYICPSGTVFGALPLLAVNELLWEFAGAQFIIKVLFAAGTLIAAVVVWRPFCRIFCPLGAFYSLFNKIAFIKMRCDKEKCTSCGSCSEACHIRLNPAKRPNSPECVRCGNCVSACKAKALRHDFRKT
ncbi:MAG: 4Fe-4S binding protein [Oscillospiraceae bacterium]|nr:4Fe-4S binding protein [Oscillospiraceae bacterium]